MLSELESDEGELRGWIYYWVDITIAHHMLGQHARELELAHASARLHPASGVPLLLAVRAQAALGDEAGVHETVDRLPALPGDPVPTAGALLLEAALELRAHDHEQAAERVLQRALEWHGEHGSASGDPAARRALARCLYHAGRLEEARTLFEALPASDRATALIYEHAHLQAQLDDGYLLLIAARTGNQQEAERLRDGLRARDEPFLFGAQWYWLAADAAAAGRPQEAVTLLRRAFVDGLPHELFLHADPHLRPLRGYPAFEALLRPRD